MVRFFDANPLGLSAVNLRRRLRPILLAATSALVAIAAAGCGDSNGDGERKNVPDQAYGEVLRGLKEAALAGQTYNAIRRAQELPPPEKAAIVAFCEMAWQIVVNREAEKLTDRAYIVSRVTTRTALNLDGPSSTAVRTVTDELRRVVNLGSLNGNLTGRYKKACYR